jgi:LPXTG-motif cell wall-anchored protein
MNIKILWLVVMVFCLSLIYPVSANADADELRIKTSPDTALFSLYQMKPGDWATRKLTVQNRGDQDFTYHTQSQFISGSEQLFNEFSLKVWDSNQILYDGKLKDFNGLQPRFLQSLNQEDLLFRVEFPYELGNEYQGLGFDVEFKFAVEGYGPGPNPDPAPNPNPVPDQEANPNPSPDPGPDPEEPEEPIDSEKPNDPNDPSNPSNPNDTDHSTNPPYEIDIEEIKPEHPIGEAELKAEPVEGQILPKTSTNMFNFVVLGIVLLLLGIILGLYESRN